VLLLELVVLVGLGGLMSLLLLVLATLRSASLPHALRSLLWFVSERAVIFRGTPIGLLLIDSKLLIWKFGEQKVWAGRLPLRLLLRAFRIVADFIADAFVLLERNNVSKAVLPALHFDRFEDVLAADVEHPLRVEDDLRVEGLGAGLLDYAAHAILVFNFWVGDHQQKILELLGIAANSEDGPVHQWRSA